MQLNVTKYFYYYVYDVIYQYENISKKDSWNSEVNASEFKKNHEEICAVIYACDIFSERISSTKKMRATFSTNSQAKASEFL